MTHEEMISYAYNPIPLMSAYRIVVPWPRAGRVTGQQLKTSEALLEGCCLKSMNGQYTARLQNDGRFTNCRGEGRKKKREGGREVRSTNLDELLMVQT